MRVAAIRVWVVVGAEEKVEEVWVIPLTRLVRVRWARSEERGVLYLTFEDGLILRAQDPDGALLEEVNRALETSGVYAVGSLWEPMWVGGE